MPIRLYVYPLQPVVTVVQNQINRINPVYARKGNDLVIQFNVVNTAGAAVDISAYTTRDLKLTGPATVTNTPALVAAGAGGIMTATLTDVNLAVAGTYELELQVTGTGIKQTLALGKLVVEDSYA